MELQRAGRGLRGMPETRGAARIAEARQELAHTTSLGARPAWAELSDVEREIAEAEAAQYLAAILAAGLVAVEREA